MLEKRTEEIEYLPPYEAMMTYQKILTDSAKDFLKRRSSSWSMT